MIRPESSSSVRGRLITRRDWIPTPSTRFLLPNGTMRWISTNSDGSKPDTTSPEPMFRALSVTFSIPLFLRASSGFTVKKVTQGNPVCGNQKAILWGSQNPAYLKYFRTLSFRSLHKKAYEQSLHCSLQKELSACSISPGILFMCRFFECLCPQRHGSGVWFFYPDLLRIYIAKI